MRNKVKHQDPAQRVKNFNEVSLGFSDEQALAEAKRCAQCKDPFCIKGCPVSVDIPAFISLIKAGKRKESLDKLKEKNNLPAICGRVCPQEDQCEKVCIFNKKGISINIGALERYSADVEVESPQTPPLGGGAPLASQKTKTAVRAAVVGSGPAGLTCAADLAKMGYSVTLYESLHIPGGVLSYGIPEFRLPKKIVAGEVDYIRSLGVKVQTDSLVGKSPTVDELFKEGVKAIFVATGAGLPQFLGIPGENLNCVYSANEFLTRINLMKAYRFPEYSTPINIGKRVAVIGGGNVALDCARCAMRLGKDVTLLYRRTETEMPARQEEIENAKEEGLKFQMLTQPVKFLGGEKGFVKGVECIKMKLGEPDASGRRRPVPIEASNFVLDVETVVVAVGQNPNPLLPASTPGLETTAHGTIKVDESCATSLKGVFAGGDITTGADTVISAMGAGKKAALEIDKYIKALS